MSLSKRHIAWAPLLIIGFALLYAIVEGLQAEPCQGEHIEWAISLVITGAFAIYFLIGYWLAVSRNYLALAIATLWAWQLLVITPVLAPACGGLTRESLWFKPAGLAFLGIVASILVLGALTSIAMYRRYRIVPHLGLVARRAFFLRLLAGATLVAVLLTAGTYVGVPIIRDNFALFGADLPAPTLALFAGYSYAPLAALPFIAVLLYAANKTGYSDTQLNTFLNRAIGLLIAVNALTSALMFAFFAPMLKACTCV